MKLNNLFLLGVFTVALFSCGRIEEPQIKEELPEAAEVKSEESFLPGVMVVEFSDELTAQIESGLLSGGRIATKSPNLNNALEEIGVISLERAFPDAGEWEERHRKAGLHRWYKIYYDENAMPRTKAPVSIGSIEGILNASPCPVIKENAFFNDPYAPSQWHYWCSDPGKTGKMVWGADVDVEPVWANYTAGRSDVIVQVNDYGVDMSHPDLGPVTIPAGPEGSKSFCYGYEGYNLSYGNHGCHCAGTIAAINNNGIGVCGLAGGNDGTGGVRILSCEIFRPSETEARVGGSGENAIVWGADHGAIISSNSWGSDFKTEIEARATKEKDYAYTKAAVDYFNEYAGTDKNGNQTGPMKGGVVFFSAGNDNWRAGWPAKLECVIAVGASSSLNTKTEYSNYGDWVDICAPGGDRNYGILSCIVEGKYGEMQGTSMACPHVAGVAALIASYFGGPGFTREMLIERLLGGASYEKVAPSQNIGPLVDAYASIAMGSTVAPDPVSDLELTTLANKITFDWKIPADPDDKVAGKFLLVLSDKASDLAGLSPTSLPEGMVSWTKPSGAAQVGDRLSWEFTDLKFETDYYCAVFACDMSGNYAAASPTATIKTAVNNAPVFDETCDSFVSVKAHEVLRFNATAHDPDGHAFVLSVEPGSKAVSAADSRNGKISVEISGRDAAPGDYTCTIVATDEYGKVSRYPFTYRILPNHAPAALKSFDNIQFAKKGDIVSFNIPEYIFDEDGERLVYRASAESAGVADVSVSGNTLKIAAKDYGMTTVTLKASDALGASSEFSFKVLLRDSSNSVDIFPNPVIGGKLNIRPEKQTSARITITSKSGATVYDRESVAGPFEPAVVDMKRMSAGVYHVNVKTGDIDSTYTVVKL